MTCLSEMNTAMTAAACHAADDSACANANIALILDAVLLASIFVVWIKMSGLIHLSLILGLLVVLLRTVPSRPKDTHPTFT